MTDNVTVTKVINQVEIGADGPQGPTGPTGPSGVISVSAPITNSGTSTSAVIGINAGVANGVATLDSDGKVPQSQIPAVAITNTYVVASQAAMLALTAQEGDVAVRTDLNMTFILAATPASTLANWQELLTPTDAVQSVDGRTGTVTLSDLYAAKTHASTHASGGTDAVTLAQSQITNLTTDLAAKAPLASPTFTGTVTIPAGSSISGVPYLGTANTFTTGTQTINTGAVGTVGLVVKAVASQTANFQEWQDSTGTVQSRVTSTGSIRTNQAMVAGNASGSAVGVLNGYTQSTTQVGLAIQGLASQTGDLAQWRNSSGTVLTLINSIGRVSINSSADPGGSALNVNQPSGGTGITVNGSGTAGSSINVLSAAGSIGIIVKGATSQTADLQQWQNSAGTVLAYVTAAGAARFDVLQSNSAAVDLRNFNSGGTVTLSRATAAATNPGANVARLYFRDGTTTGTLKLVVRAGAAGAETTILDNIPQ